MDQDHKKEGGLPQIPDIRSPHAAAVTMAAMTRLAKLWMLPEGVMLGMLCLSREEFLDLESGASLAGMRADTAERASYLLRIHYTLERLLPPNLADGWVKRENKEPLFGGAPALTLLASGRSEDLEAVAKYLESQLPGDFL